MGSRGKGHQVKGGGGVGGGGGGVTWVYNELPGVRHCQTSQHFQRRGQSGSPYLLSYGMTFALAFLKIQKKKKPPRVVEGRIHIREKKKMSTSPRDIPLQDSGLKRL